MDKKKETYVKAIIAVALLVLVWLFLRSRNGPIPATPDFSMNGFQAPYFTTNMGIPDTTVRNGPTFNAQNSITVKTGNINGLSNQYMPMFGLVGMTAVSG